MTDRIKAVVVVLEADIREDEVEPILNALRMVKGVLNVVETVKRDLIGDLVAESRVREEIRGKLVAVLLPPRFESSSR